MKRWVYCLVALYVFSGGNVGFTQVRVSLPDSIKVSLIPKYDSVGITHRKLFGENYRKEYGDSVRLPVIHLSKIGGGLVATQRGGGFQTKSIRLEDKNGNEWVLRSVEKYPEILLPEGLRQSFVKDVIKDNMSAQHPFSALVIPVLAEAIGAPHSTPVIGWVAPDPNLGQFAAEFVNTVCLLEEREPIGKSDNTIKMRKKLKDNSENTYQSELYLKMKCLDVLVGDWDRHDDQWRWRALKSDQGIDYIPVPRDRDQVFYRSDGKVQRLAQVTWFLPMMQGFERSIRNINWFLWEGREINSKMFSELDEQKWDSIVYHFCGLMTDDLFDKALRKLPEPGYTRRHDQLLEQFKERREQLPKMMNSYYHFFNRIVDIELTDKNEFIQVDDDGVNGLIVSIHKLNKEGNTKQQLYKRIFQPAVTSEIRFYLYNGSDQFVLNNNESRIRLRIIADGGDKSYYVNKSAGRVSLYGKANAITFSGEQIHKLRNRLSADTASGIYVPKDLYRRHIFYPNLGYNNDDGFMTGFSVKFTNPGFRKLPYGNAQSFSFLHSYGTSAFKIDYSGEWLKVIGKADVLLEAVAFAPSNTQNFFGLGNETVFDDAVNKVTYYRTRFNLYELSPALRWRKSRSLFSAGPTYQFYTYDDKDNKGRLINQPDMLHSADSTTVSKNKMFVGAILKYSFNNQNNDLLPSKGIFLDLKLTAYQGINSYSNAFGQFTASIAFHHRLDSNGTVILANRTGGGLTVGRPPFYQAQFLGGQGNLLGYRQFRFAGEQSLYNNLECRVKLFNFINYILPGEIGVLGLYDVGRVWKRSEESDKWHHGVGGGIFFAPASVSVIRLVTSYSKEGWYPYFAINFRY